MMTRSAEVNAKINVVLGELHPETPFDLVVLFFLTFEPIELVTYTHVIIRK